MSNYPVKVLAVQQLTHNVNAYTVEKPEGFSYTPGQATDLSILKEGWEHEKRPFTFTSLPAEGVLQFTIKSYTDHNGVTAQLLQVKPGDLFEISDAWGNIAYKGEGVFIAGGAGVTPFIAIFKQLHAQDKVGNNKLLLANRTKSDIILKETFEHILGPNFINILSGEDAREYYHGRINLAFLKEQITDFSQPFYVCGPDAFTTAVLEALTTLGAHPDALVFEK